MAFTKSVGKVSVYSKIMGILTSAINSVIGIVGSGGSYRSDTLAYQTRVVADGGTVKDMAYTDSIFALMDTQGIYSQGKVWASPSMGVKLSGSNVVKMYNLFSTSDAIGDAAHYPQWTNTQIVWNKKPSIITRQHGLTIPALTLPMYVDCFISQDKRDSSVDASYFYHGNWDPQTADGLSLQDGSDVEAGRSGGMQSAYIATQSAPNVNTKRIVTLRYGSGGFDMWYGPLQNALYNLTGTVRSNTNLTDVLTISDYDSASPYSMVDTVIFTPLAATPYAAVRNFLVNTYEGTRIIFHGASLVNGEGTATGHGSTGYFQDLVDANTSYPKGVTCYNIYAGGGATLLQMTSDALVNVDPLYRSGDVVVVIDGADDSSALSGLSDTEVYNEYLAYCLARKAAGFKVVACTRIAINPTSFPAQLASILNINSMIRAGFPSNGITVCDLYADTRLQDSTDGSYFYNDGVHPNDGGAQVIAGLLNTSILSII
jgi:hypothetical protein